VCLGKHILCACGSWICRYGLASQFKHEEVKCKMTLEHAFIFVCKLQFLHLVSMHSALLQVNFVKGQILRVAEMCCFFYFFFKFSFSQGQEWNTQSFQITLITTYQWDLRMPSGFKEACLASIQYVYLPWVWKTSQQFHSGWPKKEHQKIMLHSIRL